jgi:hypothetical protein
MESTSWGDGRYDSESPHPRASARATIRSVPDRRCLALLLGAWSAIAAFAKAAHAGSQTLVALEYEIAADASGCPDAEEFRAAVARQLQYDPFRPAADRRVAVQIARKEIGFDGRIRWTDTEGRWVGDRRLASRRSDCGEIAASLAFSVAVQIQLLATLAPPEPPTPAPTKDANSTVVVSPPEPLPPPPGPAPGPPARRLTYSVGLGPALALGVSPQATGVARVFVSGRLARLSLEIGFDAAWPTTQHQVDGSGFALDRFAGGGAACGHAGAFAACVTGTFGILRARGTGVDAPAAPSGLFSQAGARIAATLDFGGRYFAAARLDGLVMLSTWTVTLNQTATWTTPRVGALIGLDVGARF